MMKSCFINALDLAVTPSSMDGGTPARVAVVGHYNSGGNPVSSMVAQKMVTSTPEEPTPINRHDLAKAIEEQLKTILKIGIVDNTANMAVSKSIAEAKGSSPTGDEIHDIVWYREDAHENKYQKVNSLKKFNRNGSNRNANAGTAHLAMESEVENLRIPHPGSHPWLYDDSNTGPKKLFANRKYRWGKDDGRKGRNKLSKKISTVSGRNLTDKEKREINQKMNLLKDEPQELLKAIDTILNHRAFKIVNDRSS